MKMKFLGLSCIALVVSSTTGCDLLKSDLDKCLEPLDELEARCIAEAERRELENGVLACQVHVQGQRNECQFEHNSAFNP